MLLWCRDVVRHHAIASIAPYVELTAGLAFTGFDAAVVAVADGTVARAGLARIEAQVLLVPFLLPNGRPIEVFGLAEREGLQFNVGAVSPAPCAGGKTRIADDDALVSADIVKEAIESLDVLDPNPALIASAFHGYFDFMRPNQTRDPDVHLALNTAAPPDYSMIMDNVTVRVRGLKLSCGPLVDLPLGVLAGIVVVSHLV